MGWITRHLRVAMRVIALFLLIAWGCIAYFWFYKFAPYRHVRDQEWCRHHSTEAYWSEIRSSIQRIGWSHDDHVPAGLFGDADFMAWAMEHTRPEDDISSCTGGHRDLAFRMITNQYVGEDAKAWLGWWEKNKSKSQVEWIRDGFAAFGVTVSSALSPSDVTSLLILVGKTSTHGSDRIPPFVRYNALRFLRDSGFSPVEFIISTTNHPLDAGVKAGLIEYFQGERAWPKSDRVGSIRSHDGPDTHFDHRLVAALDPILKTTVHASLMGLPCLGVALIIWTRRKQKKRNFQPPAPPHG